MLDAVDRRYQEKVKEFFKYIPLMRLLGRTELNKILLSIKKRKFLHGQYVCNEGDDSE